jgi:hypothetical protein
MQALVGNWHSVADTRAIFLNCYLLMTRNVLLALDAGEFRDAEWVRSLLERFAEHYFVALDAYSKAPESAPKVWRITHEAAARSDLLVLQNLMLGVNAHINYDLVFALVEMLEEEWPTLTNAERQARYADHSHINHVIGRTIDTVQDDVICRLAPAFFLVDSVFGAVDEWMTAKLIALWRDTVWNYATQILATAGERERLRLEVEEVTMRRAEAILAPNSTATLRSLF